LNGEGNPLSNGRQDPSDDFHTAGSAGSSNARGFHPNFVEASTSQDFLATDLALPQEIVFLANVLAEKCGKGAYLTRIFALQKLRCAYM
jgi:hypothetical protein